MTLLRVFGLVLAIFFSMAFVVEGPRGGGVDAKDHLERSPRWGLTSGSMVNTGERGLGGGLEFAIDASVCTMTFIDGADCSSIHVAIDEA
ncbi:MAG: peptidase M10A and M12B matrixin and adamalysin, partial [Henriciella sp.]|nr:peptidase M10A and M12B matrixin and adamalysin [Henriciella sp.]